MEENSIPEEETGQPEPDDQGTQDEVQVQDRGVKKAGNTRKKKRGANREHITLGGLKKVEKAIRKKEKNKMRKKLGSMNIPKGRKERRGSGPLAPIMSVMFVDNTGGGELTRRQNQR